MHLIDKRLVVLDFLHKKLSLMDMMRFTLRLGDLDISKLLLNLVEFLLKGLFSMVVKTLQSTVCLV